MAGEQTRVLPFWHSMINKGLTLVSNMFCNLNLTDMETCYKVFRTDLLKSIPIRSDRFGFEPEIVMKSAKRKFRIYEVPISYHGRTYEEGKKIGWKDGAEGARRHSEVLADRRSLRRALRPRRSQQSHRHAAVPELAGAQAAPVRRRHGARGRRGHRQSRRPADGAAAALRRRRRRIRCTCTRCATAFCERPTWWCSASIPKSPADLAGLENCFDTVLCLNVLEYLDDPGRGAAFAARHAEARTACWWCWCRNGPGLFGSLDRSLGHKRRYQRRAKRGRLLEAEGFVGREALSASTKPARRRGGRTAGSSAPAASTSRC